MKGDAKHPLFIKNMDKIKIYKGMSLKDKIKSVIPTTSVLKVYIKGDNCLVEHIYKVIKRELSEGKGE